MSKKTIINAKTLKSYINKDDWNPVFNPCSISGLNFRDSGTHKNLGCVASGVYSNSINEHCAGIDQISYSLREKKYKVDRYAVYPINNSENFEIKSIDKKQYPDIHHISDRDSLTRNFPILD